MATILFLHGWRSVPGGVKPTYLTAHGHTVINPALDDDDFAAAVRTAQEAFDLHQPHVVVGSSRGGAVAMNIDSGDTPLVLLCPAWKNWGTAKTVRPDTVSLQPTVRLVQKWAKSGSQWSIARRRAWIGGVPGNEATRGAIMTRHFIFASLVIIMVQPALAATLHVPQDHKTIQAAIDVSNPGDTIAVAAGKYSESIRLKPGIILRSEGDDAKGSDGLKRAEATIIDGGGKEGKLPGVVMAEGSTLDGFTITNVGAYDELLWKKHFDSNGEELGDEEGSVQAEGTTPAISIQGVSCTVTHCIVHHNGDVGIGILGGEKTTTAPLITDNLAYRNMGGGIGVAEGAEPIIRGNTCKENLRAGIGCRKANPIITDNVCFQNIRAGIGCREGSKPVMRGNKCYRNRRAGIGCNGAKPLIVANECRENEQAGIGMQGKGMATIQSNKCIDNKLVAIGVTQESTATIADNELSRTGGVPPIIAVKDGSTATIRDNRIAGGGVAALLVQGKATVSGNTFAGAGAKQGNAIWVWENSTASITDNAFDGYRAAVNATKATVVITGNTVKQFQGTAIIVKDSQKPAHVYGNTATSADPKAKAVDVQGPSGVVADNTVKKE